MFLKTERGRTAMGDSISEQGIQNRIRISLSRGPTRLFRNNTGALQDQNGRMVHFGLCKGSPDLVGWSTIEITPDMVGKNVAVFCGIEVKKPKGRTTPLQKHFIQTVEKAGGISGVAYSLADAEEIVWNNKFRSQHKHDPKT